MLAPRCCEHGANKGFKAKRFKYHANCIFNSKTCTYCTNKRCELQIKLKDSRPNRFKCHANCMFKFQNPVIYIVQIRDFSYTKCSKYRFLSFFFQCLPSSNYSNSKFCSQVVDSYDVVEAWMFDDFLISPTWDFRQAVKHFASQQTADPKEQQTEVGNRPTIPCSRYAEMNKKTWPGI